MLRSILFVTSAAIAALGLAAAAPVIGGTVSYQATNTNFSSPVSGSGTVGAGNDIVVVSALWDVDAGADRDRLIYSTQGTFGGIWDVSGQSTMDFTLPLPAGETILNASVVSSDFANTSVSWLGNVLTVVWDEGTHTDVGYVIDIDYGAVPVPAAALLFAPAALLAARRRRAA